MGTAEEGILAEDKTGAVNVAGGSPAHRVSEGTGTLSGIKIGALVCDFGQYSLFILPMS